LRSKQGSENGAMHSTRRARACCPKYEATLTRPTEYNKVYIVSLYIEQKVFARLRRTMTCQFPVRGWPRRRIHSWRMLFTVSLDTESMSDPQLADVHIRAAHPREDLEVETFWDHEGLQLLLYTRRACQSSCGCLGEANISRETDTSLYMIHSFAGHCSKYLGSAKGV
jgi:hypothetical protein